MLRFLFVIAVLFVSCSESKENQLTALDIFENNSNTLDQFLVERNMTVFNPVAMIIDPDDNLSVISSSLAIGTRLKISKKKIESSEESLRKNPTNQNEEEYIFEIDEFRIVHSSIPESLLDTYFIFAG